MKKLCSLYNQFEELILVWSLICTVVIVFVQVIFRYIFNDSLSWSEELTRYIFIWQIWLGASYGLTKDKHIKVEVLYNFFPPLGKKIISIFANLCFLGFCIFLLVNGGELVQTLYVQNSVSPALRLPMYLVYLSLPFTSLVMALRLVAHTIGLIKSPAVQTPLQMKKEEA